MKLRKLIREEYAKKKIKNSLKEAIQKLFEKDKDFMEEVKSVMMDSAEPAVAPTTKPTTEPGTRPSVVPDPTKIEEPMPTPEKAQLPQGGLEKKKLVNGKLVKEDQMTFPDGSTDRPHQETQKRLADRTNPKATPYSDIKLFQRGDDNSKTQEKIASKQFEEIIKKADEVGRLSPGETMQLYKMLLNIEANHKPKLEALSKKIAQKELGLPQEMVDNIIAKLISPSEAEEEFKGFDVDPETGRAKNHGKTDEEEGGGGGEGGGEEGESENQTPLQMLGLTEEEGAQLVGEVQIRKIMNSMMMGGGFKLFDVLKDFKAELDAIDRRLFTLYTRIMPNVLLMHWQMPPIMIGARMVTGSVKLRFEKPEDSGEDGGEPGQEDESSQEEQVPQVPKVIKVDAKATIFPVLLHEVAKGALEYLFAIRLKKFSKNLRRAIFDVADSFEDELFHKLVGPQIWKQFFYGVELALDDYTEHNELYGMVDKKTIVPLILRKITTMKTQDFIDLVDDLLNPGEAERNRREDPLKRIQKIIHAINISIKEFMDSQNGNSGEIEMGEPNPNIEGAINQNRDEWINDLEHGANQPEDEESVEPQQEEPAQEKDYSTMDKNELSDELVNALDAEDYGLAAKLRDLINAKN